MDSNRVEGTLREAAGRVQDAAGGLLGDGDTQLRGKLRQAAGQAQNTFGQVSDGARSLTSEQPIAALAIAAGVGFLLGALLLGRRS